MEAWPPDACGFFVQVAHNVFGCRIFCRLLEQSSTLAATQELITKVDGDPSESLGYESIHLQIPRKQWKFPCFKVRMVSTMVQSINPRCPFCFFFGGKIEGDSWFTWWFNQLPGPSICPKRTPMATMVSHVSKWCRISSIHSMCVCVLERRER